MQGELKFKTLLGLACMKGCAGLMVTCAERAFLFIQALIMRNPKP